MQYQIIAVRDIAADMFAQPQYVASIGGAIRSFGDECQRRSDTNLMFAHPEHFELYHLGTYDDSNARFTLFEEPKQIALGSNYRAN